jgi:hypothetical protein
VKGRPVSGPEAVNTSEKKKKKTYRRFFTCPICKLVGDKLTDHLNSKQHGLTRPAACKISKEVRLAADAREKTLHVVHRSYVLNYLQENTMNYENTCMLLKNLGHEVIDDFHFQNLSQAKDQLRNCKLVEELKHVGW